MNQQTFDKFYGCLKDSDIFEGDSVEIVRQMRDEWDAAGRNTPGRQSQRD
jgi:hypothetical protein